MQEALYYKAVFLHSESSVKLADINGQFFDADSAVF